MTAADEYLADVEAALHVRGRARRRLLAECRDHLAEASADHGPDEAVRRFGPVADLVAAFETEVAVRRGLRGTVLTAAGALGAGVSALAMVNGADSGVTAPVAWAVVFFASAQASAVCLTLAVLRAAALRHESGTPVDVVLLCRRSAMALGFAALTLFAVGDAVPGQAPAWLVLAGPVLVCVATVGVVRARLLVRRLDRRPPHEVRDPLADVATVLQRTEVSVPAWGSRLAAAFLVALATLAAFVWNRLDHGTLTGSTEVAGVEAALALAGLVLLGPALGIRAALVPRH